MTVLTLHPDWMDAPQVRRLIAAFPGEHSLRFVGGAVRDTLLEKPVTDIDAATTFAPDAVMALLKKAGIKAIPTGIEHGTVTAAADGRSFEITTLRKDVETFGRHAKVEYTDDWEADAARRDFTANAIYLAPDGGLFDYFGGIEDLRAGRVKFIGDPETRIKEDYLRILRFFRFHAYFGKGEPDAGALAACAANAAHIAKLSGERIQKEMLKLLALPAPSPAIALMAGEVARQTFRFEIAPALLQNLESIEAKTAFAPVVMVRLAALLLPAPKMAPMLAQAWKLSNALCRNLEQLLWAADTVNAELSLPAQKRLLRQLGKDIFQQSILLRWAMEGASAGAGYAPMLALADEWTPPVFPLSGEDLKEIGMKEGKSLGDRLKALEDLWERSDYTLTREQLLLGAKGL